MFFGKKEDFQRLGLEGPIAGPTPPPALPPTQSTPPSSIDPATVEAVKRRAKEILDSGRIPE